MRVISGYQMQLSQQASEAYGQFAPNALLYCEAKLLSAANRWYSQQRMKSRTILKFILQGGPVIVPNHGKVLLERR